MSIGVEAANKAVARELVAADGVSIVKRALADGDLVGVHSHRRGTSAGDPGSAVIDILRFERGRVAERWTLQRRVRPTGPGERDEFEGADASRDGEHDETGRAANRELVLRMQRMLFEEHRVDEAIDRCFDAARYAQHAPGAPDGVEFIRAGFKRRFREHPQAASCLQHVIADGDLVLIHRRSRLAPDAPLRLVCDIFRLEDGRIVEHWDVTQRGDDETDERNPRHRSRRMSGADIALTVARDANLD